MHFTSREAKRFAAFSVLILACYWFMLETIFEGEIVAGVIEVINRPDRACSHEHDGTRVCQPLTDTIVAR